MAFIKNSQGYQPAYCELLFFCAVKPSFRSSQAGDKKLLNHYKAQQDLYLFPTGPIGRYPACFMDRLLIKYFWHLSVRKKTSCILLHDSWFHILGRPVIFVHPRTLNNASVYTLSQTGSSLTLLFNHQQIAFIYFLRLRIFSHSFAYRACVFILDVLTYEFWRPIIRSSSREVVMIGERTSGS